MTAAGEVASVLAMAAVFGFALYARMKVGIEEVRAEERRQERKEKTREGLQPVPSVRCSFGRCVCDGRCGLRA